jgi:hypothetical protein
MADLKRHEELVVITKTYALILRATTRANFPTTIVSCWADASKPFTSSAIWVTAAAAC